MPTVSTMVTDAPVDLVSAMSLTEGATYAFQSQAAATVMLHAGGVLAPATNPQPPATRISGDTIIEVTIGEEAIWAWTPYGEGVISATQIRQTLGPPRNAEAIDISAGDYVRPQGFILQVNAAGTVVYSALDGGSDTRTEVFSGAGVVSIGGVPLLVHTVYMAGTTNSLSMTAGFL